MRESAYIFDVYVLGVVNWVEEARVVVRSYFSIYCNHELNNNE